MKKNYRIALAILATFAVAISCEKELPAPEEEIVPGTTEVTPQEPVKEQVTITASIPVEGLTKVTLSQDGTDKKKIKLAWEDDDVITINSETFTIIPATIANEGKTASFTGTAPDPIGGKYNISYSDLPGSFATQIQSADGNTDHLGYAVALNGASDYESFEFSESGATTLGATLEQSSVLSLRASLPDGIAATVKKVIFKASEDVFNGGNTLTVNITTPGDTDSDNLLKVYATLLAGDVDLAADMDLFIQFQVSDNENDKYTAYRLFTSGTNFIKSGNNQYMGINCSNIDKYAGISDDGTAAHPYLIADQHQVAAINALATGGQTTYFKMIDDVDMTGVTHNPINTNSGYTQVVNFDGNSKTIRNLATHFFYVFKGSVYDLTLDHSSTTSRGILAEFIQGGDNIVSNVTVSNGTVNSGSSNVGGLVGQINNGSGTCATISNSTVSGTDVSGAGVVGGFIGFANDLVSISGCTYIGGTVTSSGRYCGGFLGSTANMASIISDCHVENATITSNHTDDARCGGFVGQSQTSVQIKGCTVGTVSEKVTINTALPDDSKVLNAGGFVGVNYGTITKNGSERSKAYVHVKSSNNKGQQINVGGFVGFHRGTIEYSDAIVDMSELQGQYIGGFSGYMMHADSKADNCTLQGSVKGNNYTGGFVGVVDNALSITNCQVLEGTVVVGQSTAGGFAAQIKAGTVENCSAHVDLQCRGGNDGGFVGALIGGTVHSCSSAGTISLVSGSNNVFGGFAGYVDGTDLTKCSSTVNITVARSYVGGLVGDFKSANTVRECFYSGTISGPYNYKGGLIGITQAAAVITNCYTSGEIVASSGTQIYGGIVGELKAGGSVTNCYSTMDITHGGRATGGIVGRACSGGWPVSNASGNTISKCIAWNPAITFDGDAGTSASSGAIVGYTSFMNILNNCYRRYDMVYKNSNTAVGTTCQTSMVDQVDCDGTNWAINGSRPAGGTPAGTSADAQYQAPYYGVAAASDATVSSIAQSLGWSSDVWDFTGDLPTLK